MRSIKDRIRQAVSFELIGILIVTPIFAWAFDHPMGDMGILVVLGATAATAWNYLFNLGFDHLLNWRRGAMSERPCHFGSFMPCSSRQPFSSFCCRSSRGGSMFRWLPHW